MRWVYYLTYLTLQSVPRYLPYLPYVGKVPEGTRYLPLGASSGDGMPPSRVLLAVLALPQTCPPLRSSSPTGKDEVEVLRHGAAAECKTRTTRRRGES